MIFNRHVTKMHSKIATNWVRHWTCLKHFSCRNEETVSSVFPLHRLLLLTAEIEWMKYPWLERRRWWGELVGMDESKIITVWHFVSKKIGKIHYLVARSLLFLTLPSLPESLFCTTCWRVCVECVLLRFLAAFVKT